MDVRPRLRFERMIWSKSMIDGSLAALSSRSWINSLKAVGISVKRALRRAVVVFTLGLL